MGKESQKGVVVTSTPAEFVRINDQIEENAGFFRSASMSLIQLYIPTEAAQAVVSELGELGSIQFRDLNPDVSSFQRTFTGEIRKLDEMERKIKILLEQSELEEVTVRSWLSAGPQTEGNSMVSLRGKALQELNELSPQLTEAESRIMQLDENQKEVQSRYSFMLEWLGVLVALKPFLINLPTEDVNSNSLDGFMSSDDKKALSLEAGGEAAARGSADASFVAGSIPKKKLAAFERVLWRALRGNVFIRSADIAFGSLGVETTYDEKIKQEPRSAFLAYVHGQETLGRLRKICEALGCTLFDVDPSPERREETAIELHGKLEDMFALLFNTHQAKRAALGKVSESLERWLILVRKKKAIFDTMNKFSCDSDVSTRKYYLAEGWCTTSTLSAIDTSIKTASERAGLNVSPVLNVLDSTKCNPPTHFPTNRFTQTFQDMTDAYGIAKYKEANPSIFMIITFPFLFAVMFGDLGHGLMMAAFAAWMVLYEKKLLSQRLDEIFGLIFSGRYIILMMGLFSIFTGLVYNDIFSRSLAFFPSGWRFIDGVGQRVSSTYVYPFGIDPAWSFSSTAMLFLNSFKMKLSILLGVVQMMFGLVVALMNMLHFKNHLDIFCMLIPQVIFMLSIYGYMALLIVYKWYSGWDSSILNIMIGMILKFGSVEGPQIYPGQQLVQICLIILAIICIPWMFLAKPIYLLLEKRKHGNDGTSYQPASTDSSGSGNGTESVSSTTKKAAAEDEEHDMSELWVHQLIHTIEFVLGSVSNTASYLRLWALSLAHAELSDVLWNMTIKKAAGTFYMLVLMYALWFQFTVGILVVMEGMSAFLHALRLHWVEFNNKFFMCGGTKFEPFTLRDDLMLLQDAAHTGEED